MLRCFFFSSRRRHTRCALVTGVQTWLFRSPDGDGDFFEPYDPLKHNFNSNPFLNAVSPIERISTAFFAHYDVTDNVTAFGEFLYTFRKSNQIATPGTLLNLAIPATNPTNRSEEHTSELHSLMRISYAV